MIQSSYLDHQEAMGFHFEPVIAERERMSAFNKLCAVGAVIGGILLSPPIEAITDVPPEAVMGGLIAAAVVPTIANQRYAKKAERKVEDFANTIGCSTDIWSDTYVDPCISHQISIEGDDIVDDEVFIEQADLDGALYNVGGFIDRFSPLGQAPTIASAAYATTELLFTPPEAPNSLAFFAIAAVGGVAGAILSYRRSHWHRKVEGAAAKQMVNLASSAKVLLEIPETPDRAQM